MLADAKKKYLPAFWTHIKKYLPVYLVWMVFSYCYSQIPQFGDQLVAEGIYIRYGGLLNYATGYCVHWVETINGRLISSLVSGILEQNYSFYLFLMGILLALFPVMCMRLFAKRKEDEGRILWIASLTIFLLSRGIEGEVLVYAIFIYIAPAFVLAYLIKRLPVYMPLSAEEKISLKHGAEYLGVVLVLSLWLENLTFGMVVVSACLFLWDLFFNKRKNWSFFTGTVVSFLCLLGMASHRQSAISIGVSLDEMILQVCQKASVTLDTVFLSNAMLTAGFSLIALLYVGHAIPQWKRRAARIGGILCEVFWAYCFVVHLVQAYNDAISFAKSVPVPMTLLEMTCLPVLPVKALLPPEYSSIRLLLYVFFCLSLLLPILLSEQRLMLLVAYGFSMSSLCVIFLTREYFGDRVITPSLLFLILAAMGILADLLPYLPSGTVFIKTTTVLVISLLVFKADYYWCRYTSIGWVRQYNDKVILYVVERQMMDEWDYENDVMRLKAYSGFSVLWGASLSEADARYPFFCQHYDLDFRTKVEYR